MRHEGRKLNCHTESLRRRRVVEAFRSAALPLPVDGDPEEDADNGPGNILGPARIQCRRVYHHMDVLTEAEQEQIEFWQAMLDHPLQGDDDAGGGRKACVFVFIVTHFTPLLRQEPLQQFSSSRYTSFTPILEDGQPTRLRQNLAPNQLAVDCDVPNTALRLPTGFAHLIAAGIWERSCVPCFSGSKARTAASIQWRNLGLRLSTLDLPPVPMSFMKYADAPVLSQKRAHAVADLVRAHAARIDCSTEAGQSEFKGAEEAVLMMQAMSDQLAPISFQKSILELHGKANEVQVERRCNSKTYQVSFMLKVMCLADVLRSSASIRATIKLACDMVLPSSLKPIVQELIDKSATIMPDKSTVSRWRFLIDGAYMQVQRLDFARYCEEGSGYTAYMMCDSSMQHGRDFEHMVMQVILTDNLLELTKLAESLMWFRRYYHIRCNDGCRSNNT